MQDWRFYEQNISKKQAYSFNTSNNFKIELPEDVSFIINTIEKTDIRHMLLADVYVTL